MTSKQILLQLRHKPFELNRKTVVVHLDGDQVTGVLSVTGPNAKGMRGLDVILTFKIGSDGKLVTRLISLNQSQYDQLQPRLDGTFILPSALVTRE